MSEVRSGDGPNPLETTRIGGGMSARVGAVAVVVVLSTVVWIGISGRPPAPTPTATAVPIVANVATPEAPATPQGSTGPTPASPTPAPATGQGDFRASEHYTVVATLANRQYLGDLMQLEPGHMTAEFTVPIPPPATRGTIELAQVWSTVSHDAWQTLATWDLHLESLSAASGRRYVVLDRTMRPRPNQRDVPLPVVNGYVIKVSAQSGVARGLVSVDVIVGDGRHKIRGEDGIFGWPTVAQLRPKKPLPRMRGAYNYCRWDDAPLAAPPRPGTDEAAC